MYTYMCLCMCIYIYICSHANTNVHIHIDIYSYTNSERIDGSSHVCIYIYMHIYVYSPCVQVLSGVNSMDASSAYTLQAGLWAKELGQLPADRSSGLPSEVLKFCGLWRNNPRPPSTYELPVLRSQIPKLAKYGYTSLNYNAYQTELGDSGFTPRPQPHVALPPAVPLQQLSQNDGPKDSRPWTPEASLISHSHKMGFIRLTGSPTTPRCPLSWPY